MLLDTSSMLDAPAVPAIDTTLVLAYLKTEQEKGLGDILIYFPLYFTGFAIAAFALQVVVSIFMKNSKSNFD